MVLYIHEESRKCEMTPRAGIEPVKNDSSWRISCQSALRLWDLCNILALFGLAAASSQYPCPVCILPKTLFPSIPYRPDLLRDCNNTVFARTRGNILAEATKSSRTNGVKQPPLPPLPLDLESPLISIILYCSLHGRLRITSIVHFFLLIRRRGGGVGGQWWLKDMSIRQQQLQNTRTNEIAC